nr:16S rRNA (cytosine(1402)-N(4))-methyltransferase RsmH [candidate division Zixibacteria bacterium]
MFHRPVLVEETAHYLVTRHGGIYLDMTCGGGGHLKHISGILAGGATLIGIDRDPEAIVATRENLHSVPQSKFFINSSFARVEEVLVNLKISAVDGILFDLGISSYQIDEGRRGFAFMQDGPLDMRMGVDSDITAEDIVNRYSESELTRIFRDYGEERRSAAVARAICRERQIQSITTTGRLRNILERVFPPLHFNASLARIFQAIRIEVNRELEQLRQVLPLSFNLLKTGGRLVVISYHSLEDRIVKRFMTEKARGCICPPRVPVCTCGHQPEVRLLTKKVIKPSPNEIANNSRARSARLRAIEKIV